MSVAHLSMRTTSSLESFNSAINRSVKKKQNYFKFVERLRIHESRKADRMHNLAHDVLPAKQFTARHKADRLRHEKIKENTDLLRDGVISTAEFLSIMANEGIHFYQHF